MRVRWIWVLGLAALGSGCSARAPRHAEPPAPVAERAHAAETITFYGDSEEPGKELDRALAERFERGTGIRVSIVPKPSSTTEAWQVYRRLFERRSTGVDVLMIDLIWPQSFAPDLLDLPGDWAASFPDVERCGMVGARRVAIPLFVDLGLLFYRRDLAGRYGMVSPPGTWSDLARLAARIQSGERKDHPGFAGFAWQGAAYEGLTCNALEWQVNDGAPLLDPVTHRPGVDRPEAVQAFRDASRWVGSISPAGVLRDQEEDSLEDFRTGGAAFMRNWSYYGAKLDEPGAASRGRWAVAPVPGGRGVLGGWMLGINARSLHPAAARAFVRYMTSPAVQRWRAVEGRVPPTIADLYEDPGVRNQPIMAVLGRALPRAIVRPTQELGPRYPAFSQTYYEGVSKILHGSDPAGTARFIERDLTAISGP